jgi:hypothetical protein
MPKTKDGGWIIDDGGPYSEEAISKLILLIKKGKSKEAKDFIDSLFEKKPIERR